jgi:3-methyladenine DNA glycosylase AlkD
MSTAEQLQSELDALGNPADAEFLQRFFKTGEGQYGAGDIFIGIRVPVLRKIAAKYRDLPLNEIEKLLESPIHEHRLSAAIIMAESAKRANNVLKKNLFDLYLKRSDRLNNWDIIDISCRDVVGDYLMNKPRDVLVALAKSNSLWDRRIAIVSTWQFIRVGQLDDTFKIAALLLNDTHDLIHKATGWMLREAGKKDEAALKRFLDKHTATMPRTTLRYAIERLHPEDQVRYMQQKTVRPARVQNR